MKSVFRCGLLAVSAATLATVVGISSAQTPAQLEYERQQREYWRQQEQQRQEQQRQQQLMQDNARRQQEGSSRSNAGTGQGQGIDGPSGTSKQASPGGGAGQSVGDKASAARATWEKRPPLPADRNPLLGKWTRPASARSNSSDPFAGLAALAKGGLCEALFGGGTFEFRADKLVGMDERTKEQELDKVEYRGDAKHVVVLPKTTFKIIEFDFDGPNRISWTGQNCVLVRVGNSPPSASAAAGTVAASAMPAAANSYAKPGGGVLSLSVGAPSAKSSLSGRKFWVLKEDPQVALIKGGLKSTPDGSALQNWLRACYTKAVACEKGANALKPYSVGIATSDASGHAKTPPLTAGRYWVLSEANVDNKHLMWSEPVEVRAATSR